MIHVCVSRATEILRLETTRAGLETTETEKCKIKNVEDGGKACCSI